MPAASQYTCPSWPEIDRRSSDLMAALVEARAAAFHLLREAFPFRSDIEAWHRLMFSAFTPPGHAYYAGNVRRADKNYPCLGRDVAVVGIPGTRYARVPQELNALLADLRTRAQSLELRWHRMSCDARAKEIGLLIGVTIGRFIQVHPFINGNGRTSRLLWQAILYRFGIPPQYGVFNHPPDPSYDDMMAAAMVGDYGPCVVAVLNAVSASGATLLATATPSPDTAK